MYLHRIALSVILPPRAPQDQGEPISPLQTLIKGAAEHLPSRNRRMGISAVADLPDSPEPATPPRGGLVKYKSVGTTGSSSPVVIRGRSSSFNSETASSAPLPEMPGLPKLGRGGKGKSPLLKQETVAEISTQRKSRFSKADSVMSDIGGAKSTKDGEGGAAETEEWRGLNLDVLRRRIQRLVVLMNLSEPGTIPNASILASLVDLVSLCVCQNVIACCLC